MTKGKKYSWSIILLSCWCLLARSQPALKDTSNLPEISFIPNSVSSPNVITQSPTSRPFVVGEIFIEGNNRTKPYIIERELPFKSGDSVNLTELVKGFEVGRQQLMNTRLFNEVIVALKSFRGHVVDIAISVKERWYVFPIPYLKPVDRNLSEWAKQGYGTDRLNYGFKFTYYNFTGRNDKLRLWLITGYTRQIQFQYEQPYADKTLKHGYKVGFSYGSNREVNYATHNNQQMFNDSLDGIKRWNVSLEYDYRPGLRTFHAVRFGYQVQTVDSQLLWMNPKYFNSGSERVAFPELSYTISHFNVDYIPYPLTGWMGEASILKRGLNSKMNMWQLGAKFTKSWPVAKKTYYALQSQGVLRYPFEQPYINSQLFGYGDFYLRGLEQYVVDGAAGVMFRQTLRRELLRFDVPVPVRSKTHGKVPFKVYAKAFTDVGYAYNKSFPDNSLTNRMLYTVGAGIDITTFYDFVLRVDYSFNQLGQNGVFLHLKNEF